MIEFHLRPGNGIVALLAGLRESRLDVVWIRGAVEVTSVTTYTVCRRPLELAAEMACGAFERRMRASEREACHFQVIETGAIPGIHAAVTLQASGRKTGLLVVGRCCLQVVIRVTGAAVGGEPYKLARGRILVASIAVNYRVRSDQRKAILMLIDRLHRNLPSVDGMASFASCAHLSPVNVGVAFRTVHADVGEHGVHMAFLAPDSFMHATQRVLGLVVIELRDVSNRFPTRKRMAVLTGDVQWPVRAMCTERRILLLGSRQSDGQYHNRQ